MGGCLGRSTQPTKEPANRPTPGSLPTAPTTRAPSPVGPTSPDGDISPVVPTSPVGTVKTSDEAAERRRLVAEAAERRVAEADRRGFGAGGMQAANRKQQEARAAPMRAANDRLIKDWVN